MSRISTKELEELSCEILSIYGVDLYPVKRPSGWSIAKRIPGSSGCSYQAVGLSKREIFFYLSALVFASDLHRIKKRDQSIWMRSTAEKMARDLIKS